MNRALFLFTMMPLAALTACGDAEEGGSNVALRDMEVIDGTANDAMVDLDNAQSDIAPMANAGAPESGPGSPVAATPSNDSAAEAEAPNAE